MLTLTLAADARFPESRIVATLRNDSDLTIRFLYWNTVFDPVCPRGLQVESPSLRPATYRGPTAKYTFDPDVSLTRIPPGEEISEVVDVSANYKLPAAARFTVSMVGSFRGIVGEAPAGFNQCTGLEPLEVRTEPLEVRLTPVDSDKELPLAAESTVIVSPQCDVPICWKSYYEPPIHCTLGRARYAHARVDGGSANQIAEARSAVDRLFDRIALRGAYRLEVKNDGIYRRWFGTYTEERAKKVRAAISGIRGEAVCKSFVIYVLAQCAKPDLVAMFRKPGTDDRYGALGLCRPFFKEVEVGRDSRAGTLAHELSHGYADTVDHEYGAECCLALARSDPWRAVENADSIQYYLEDALLSLKSRPADESGTLTIERA